MPGDEDPFAIFDMLRTAPLPMVAASRKRLYELANEQHAMANDIELDDREAAFRVSALWDRLLIVVDEAMQANDVTPTERADPEPSEVDDQGSATELAEPTAGDGVTAHDDLDGGTGHDGVDHAARERTEVTQDPLADYRVIWHQLREDRQARIYLGDIGELSDHANNPAEVWSWLHRASLRLPKEVAQRLRQDTAAAAGLRSDNASPLGIPDFDGGSGIRLSTSDNVDGEWRHSVSSNLSRVASDFPEVLSVVGDVLTLLHGGEAGMNYYYPAAAPPRLLDNARTFDQYKKPLVRRLDELNRASPDSEQELALLVDIDETLRSAVHMPLPAPDSWWGVLPTTLEPILRERAQRQNAEVYTLNDSNYQSYKAYTEGNVNLKGADDKQYNKVLRTLRVAYRLEKRLFKGRVMYGDR